MSRRVVDCTKVLRHGAADAFTAHEFERAGQPRTLTHRIEMDADVGTHVLAPRRYLRWGSDLAGLSPETFFGEGLVAHLEVTADAPDIDSNRLEDIFGRELRTRDIVVIAARGSGVAPCFTAQAAQWLFVRGAKLVALADGISVGRDEEPDDERVILSTLLENDVPVVRGLVNTETLSTERMAFMALPAPAADVTAWPVRFVALDPGLDPTQQAVAAEPDVDQEAQAEPPAADPADQTAKTQPDEPAEAESMPEPSESGASTDQDTEDSLPEPDSDEDSAADEPSSEDDPDDEDLNTRSAEA
ncbi:MAG: cyclase family protein [Chloroflexi bacterium]|nr:cyclase family protein [Chloroflexota bacterium]